MQPKFPFFLFLFDITLTTILKENRVESLIKYEDLMFNLMQRKLIKDSTSMKLFSLLKT